MEKSLASRYQIQGFPTIKMFNPLNDAPTDYQNQRDAKSFCKAAFSVRILDRLLIAGFEEPGVGPSVRQGGNAEAPPADEGGAPRGAVGGPEGREGAEASGSEGNHDAGAVQRGVHGGDVHAALRPRHPRLDEDAAGSAAGDDEGGGGGAGVGSVRVRLGGGRLAVRSGAEIESGVRIPRCGGCRREIERERVTGRLAGTRDGMRCRRARSRSII